jgi:alpha-galactosidase
MKITVIGGGSYQWAPTIIADILQFPSLSAAHLVLQDIDPAPLPLMESYAKQAITTLGADATVETTTDQRAAIDGADAVVVTISTGGFRSMRHDLAVPERFGIKQSVGDSVGPGGINRALRNIPVLVGIARDMEDLAPDAWLLNITNPMTVLTRAVLRETSIKAVGLCHEIMGFLWDLSITGETPIGDIKPTLTGVNHFPVFTELDMGGRDGIAWMRELAAGADTEPDDSGEQEWKSRTLFRRRHAVKIELLARYGALPAAGDRHLAEFLPGILTPESDWGAGYGVHLTTIEDREKHQGQYVEHVQKMLDGSEPIPTWQSGEMVAPVLDSIVTGTPRELPVNIGNHGQAADLPPDVVVEGMCVVDASGIRGRDVVSAPAPLAELLRRHAVVQELTVEAAVSGDRDLAVAAMSLDPLAGRGDLKQTTQMTDELLAATAEWLPQFA